MPGPTQQRAVLRVQLCNARQGESHYAGDKAKQIYRALVAEGETDIVKNRGSVLRSGPSNLAAILPLADNAFSVVNKLLNKAVEQYIPVRAGLHYGEGTDESCDELAGIADQMCDLAAPGEILLTASTMPYLCAYFRDQCTRISSNAAVSRRLQREIYACNKLVGDQTLFAEEEPVDHATDASKCLLLTQGQLEFIVLPDSEPLLIGRAPGCDITLQGSRCSRNHAILESQNNNYTLRDQSTNGTYVVNKDEELYPLNRQSTTLSGTGKLCFGATTPDNTQDVISFDILDSPPATE